MHRIVLFSTKVEVFLLKKDTVIRIIWLIFVIALVAGAFLFFRTDSGKDVLEDIKSQFQKELDNVEKEVGDEINEKKEQAKEELKDELKDRTNEAIDRL